MNSVNSKCIVCCDPIPVTPQQGEENSPKACQLDMDTFCSYLNIPPARLKEGGEEDGGENYELLFSFCADCKNSIHKLHTLEQQQKEICGIVSNIANKVIKTASADDDNRKDDSSAEDEAEISFANHKLIGPQQLMVRQIVSDRIKNAGHTFWDCDLIEEVDKLSDPVKTRTISTQTPPVRIFYEGQPQLVLKRLSADTVTKCKRRKRPAIKYKDDSDTDFMDNQDSFPSPSSALSDDYDEDEDDTQPVNYLDINIKVEDNEWQEPQVSTSSKLKFSKKKRSTKATNRLLENKNLKVNLRDYLSRRTKYQNPCWYCKRWDFNSPSDCVEHTKQEHLPLLKGGSAVVCERCSKICPNSKSMDTHLKRCDLIPMGEILSKPFICPVNGCGKSFASKKLLVSHSKSHSDERPFSCDEIDCSFRAKTVSVLNMHKRFRHPVGPQDAMKVQCNICGTVVKNAKCLYSHRFKMHTPKGNRKYKERQQLSLAKRRQQTTEKRAEASSFCLDCKVDFFSVYGLTMHRKNFHPQDLEKKFVCDLCGQTLRSAASLRTHLRVHSDERPYVCERCGKGFKHNSNLKDHAEQVHTEEGRLKYNQRMREKTRKRKFIASQLMAVKQL